MQKNRCIAIIACLTMMLSVLFPMGLIAYAETPTVDLATPGAYTPSIDWQNQQGLEVTQADGEVKISNAEALSATNAGTFVQTVVDLDQTPIFYYDVKDSNIESCFQAIVGDKTVEIWNTGGSWFIDNNDGNGLANGSSEVDLAEKTGLTGEQTVTFEVYLSFWGTGAATEAGEKYLIFSGVGFKGVEEEEDPSEDPSDPAEDPAEVEAITAPTRLPLNNPLYDASVLDVTVSDDGYSYTVGFAPNQTVWGGTVDFPVTVDLDKVPYLYIDLGRTEVWWDVLLYKQVEVEKDDGTELGWEMCPHTSGPSAYFNGATGLTRVNMAELSGLTGEQNILIQIKIWSPIATELFPEATNTINGIYFDGEEFSFDTAATIDEPTILDPATIITWSEFINLQLKGEHGFKATVQPMMTWEPRVSVAMNVDLDKIHYLCLNVSELVGEKIAIYMEDYTDVSKGFFCYVVPSEESQAPGTVIFDLLKDENGNSTNLSGVRNISVHFGLGIVNKNSITVESMYLTGDDFALPAGLDSQDGDNNNGDNDGNDDSNTDNDTGNTDNGDNDGNVNDDNDNSPLTGVESTALPMVLMVMAAAVIVFTKRKIHN